MFCIGYTQTLLKFLDILGIVEFHEVDRTLLEELHEETLSIVEFHKVRRNFLEASLVLVFYGVWILYL